MVRIAVVILLVFGFISFGYGQDSAKKVVPVKPPPPKPTLTAPNAKYKTYKYHTYHTKVDSAAAKTGVPQTAAIKPDTAAPVLTDKSLNGQYHYLLTKVYHYQEPVIGAFWKIASDTLNAYKRKLKEDQNKLNLQAKTTDSLKAKIADQATALSDSRVDGIEVLGMIIPKATYNVVVWSLVAIFGITAAVVIFRSGSLKREAKYRTLLYSELEEEFKTFKAKANDKEKKLARELQTERNKLDELLGRG
jgi:hypothetical protein